MVVVSKLRAKTSQFKIGRVMKMANFRKQNAFGIVVSIPKGYVASYGQIAKIAGLPGCALCRYDFGQITRDTRLPWHRVVNASLAIAPRGGGRMLEQKRRLRDEGVSFEGNRVSPECHWQF